MFIYKMEIIELKELIRMIFIYRALESGWTVRKSFKPVNTFEFIKPRPGFQNSSYGSSLLTRRSVSDPITHNI